MNLFGFELHRDPDPWRHAPPWAVELRQMLLRLLQASDLALEELDDVRGDVDRIEEDVNPTHVEITLGTPTDQA